MLQVFRDFDPFLSCSSEVPWNRVKFSRRGFKIDMGSTRREKKRNFGHTFEAKEDVKRGRTICKELTNVRSLRAPRFQPKFSGFRKQ